MPRFTRGSESGSCRERSTLRPRPRHHTARILSKLLWAKETRSELQMRDIRQIILAQPAMDWSYLDMWATRLDLGALLREVRR